MHFLYIIYSPAADKYYTGETNNVPARVEQHNRHKNLKALTGAAYDWETKLIFKCRSKEEALYLENQLKEKSRIYLEKVLNRPQLLEEILSGK